MSTWTKITSDEATLPPEGVEVVAWNKYGQVHPVRRKANRWIMREGMEHPCTLHSHWCFPPTPAPTPPQNPPPPAEAPKPGTFYRHRKGALYQFLNEAHHSETYEKLAVYQDESGGVWARPLAMFCDGRFQPVPTPPASGGQPAGTGTGKSGICKTCSGTGNIRTTDGMRVSHLCGDCGGKGYVASPSGTTAGASDHGIVSDVLILSVVLPPQDIRAIYEWQEQMRAQRDAAEQRAEAARRAFKAVLYRLQVCLQPPGSPPALPPQEFAEWIIRSAAERIIAAEQRAKGLEKVLSDFPGIRSEAEYNAWLFKRDAALAKGGTP